MDEKALTLDLSNLQKTKISVKHNDDDIRDLYLNLSDINIIVRFKEKYKELQELESKAFSTIGSKPVNTENNAEEILNLADALSEVDTQMRECIDYIFDSNVSEVCVPFGSMYDIVDGEMRCEHVVDAISALYESNIHKETKKLESKIKKHTDKYVKK